jgi:hypothetical protein
MELSAEAGLGVKSSNDKSSKISNILRIENLKNEILLVINVIGHREEYYTHYQIA